MFFTKNYFGLQGVRLQVAVGVLAGLDFLLFGYDQGVMSSLLTLDSFVTTFPQINTNVDKSTHRAVLQGITVSAYTLGCFFGAITTIFIGDSLGRRRAILLGSSIMIIGATIMCSSFSLPQFVIARVITGFGNGINTSTIPTWQSECSRAHRRGMMVMIEGALITGGICISYWIDFGFFYTDPSTVSWRFPIGFQIFFAAIIVLFIMDLPESPRWLILKGREDEAMNVLGALNGLPTDDKFIYNEFLAIKDVVIEAAQGSFKDLFTMDRDRNFHRVALAYVNQMFQQISGINLITYYASTIYQSEIGLSPFISRLLGACNGTEYFIASWIAVFTIEKFGRRPLMLFGAAGQSFSMVVLTIVNYLAQNKIGTPATGIVAALFLYVFNSFFAVGWLGMTWLYPAEIVPLRIRAQANALSTSANWAFNFMVVMITPVAFASIRYQTYIIFAVINVFIYPVVYFFYPETAYRSLEEMDTIFHNTDSVFDVVHQAKVMPRRYGKNGELLINYEETEEHRRSSVTTGAMRAAADKHNFGLEKGAVEHEGDQSAETHGQGKPRENSVADTEATAHEHGVSTEYKDFGKSED